MAKKLTRAVKLWAGVSDGDVVVWDIDDGFGGFGERTFDAPCIYLKREQARERFSHYEPVIVVPAAEYERLTRKAAKRGRRAKSNG